VLADGGEERPYLVGVDARGVGDVDDGVDAVQRGGQPRVAGQVHADRPGEHQRVVPNAPHRLDGPTADQSGPTGDRDPHDWASSRCCPAMSLIMSATRP
jgi:hypothetical protein